MSTTTEHPETMLFENEILWTSWLMHMPQVGPRLVFTRCIHRVLALKAKRIPIHIINIFILQQVLGRHLKIGI
jgi:hypothetical protein